MAIQTVPAAAVATPVELLRDLNRRMESAQHGADHPWRVAIAETLAAHAEDAAQQAPATGSHVELASSALLEISNLSIVMRRLIAEHDRGGVVEPLTRGMLHRVQVLSEAVSDCTDRSDESPSIDMVTRTIYCVPCPTGATTALEVHHG